MKKLALIGGLTILIGAIVFVSAFAATGWDISKISTQPVYEQKQYTTQNRNQTISMKDRNKSVTVGLSNDDQIHITYYENEKEYYQIDDHTNSLNIENKNNYKWYDYIFNIHFQTPSVTILLPENFEGNLNIETSNATIDIDSVTMKQLKATTSNGYVGLKNLSGTDDVTLTTSNNKVEISDINITGKLFCSTSNGGIHLDNTTAKNIEATTTNNEIKAKQTQIAESTLLQTSNGQIWFQNLALGNSTTLSTSNNRVTGTIAGNASDFSIHSQTSNGKNNLPENFKSGDKNLKVSTSNGEIFVEFAN